MEDVEGSLKNVVEERRIVAEDKGGDADENEVGALLHGNPEAHARFVSENGQEMLAIDVLETLSNVRDPEANANRALARLD